MEHVGTVLWSLRTSAGWTMGQLARQSGVSTAALSRWESSQRQPRVPELLAVLEALNASPAQRARALACIDAPRALRHLRQSSGHSTLGAPPTAGDLLRALRLRRGWAQQEVADRAGVGRTAVVRWENGERLPSTEQIQALCYILEAREEEFVALTAGRFSEPAIVPASKWDEKAAVLLQRREQFSRGAIIPPGDLFYLTLEQEAWLLAAEHEQAKPVLAQILAFHAQELGNYKRWSEAGAVARRALALVPRQEQEPEWVLRAALMQAAAAVFAGHRIAPERGVRELRGWLPHSTSSVFSAWMLSDMAQYTALAGQAQRGVEIAAQALALAEQSHSGGDRALRLRDYARLLMQRGRLEEALDCLPCTRPEDGDLFVHEALARAEIHERLGHLPESQDWLQRAYAVLPNLNAEHLHPQLDALAHRLFGADYFLRA